MQNHVKQSSISRWLHYIYSFTPVAVETLGAIGQEAFAFFQDLGRRIFANTAEPSSFQFLMQRLSVTVQRGNAACVLGTVPSSRGLDDFFIFRPSYSSMYVFFLLSLE